MVCNYKVGLGLAYEVAGLGVGIQSCFHKFVVQRDLGFLLAWQKVGLELLGWYDIMVPNAYFDKLGLLVKWVT